MNRKSLTAALVIVLTIALVAPAAFFIAPQRTSAAATGIVGAASCIGNLLGLGTNVANVAGVATGVPVTSAAILMQNTISASANTTSCITDTILMPLARAIARMILQQITASTINWINGNNGTGQPSYMRNLLWHLQGVGDSVALPFIAQIASAFNSPFGPAISSSLRTAYSQQTSLAGFFAANQCTLAQSSPNINSFLAGNWSQGGIGAWFALTTQSQNNPYMLYQAAQSQLGSLVGNAQAARTTTLNWGQGFLSWCGASNTTASSYDVADAMGGGLSTARGVNPGDNCTNSDGSPGSIQTPGSIIHDYTQKAVVASGIEQLINANDLDTALGAIVTALAKQVLGGMGGLFGASQPSSSNAVPLTTQLQNYSAGNASGAASAISLAQSALSQVTTYTSAWNTIAAAANIASTSAQALMGYCNAQATDPNASQTAISVQVNAAQVALATEIAPVLAQSQAAFNSVLNTQALALKVEAESSTASASTDAASTLSTDTQTLATMPPSATDVVIAQQNAQTSGGATASPSGSLTVSGGSLVDQMNLISTNATALKASCTPSAPAADNSYGGGQGGN